MEFKGTKGKWHLDIMYDEYEKPKFRINSNESIIASCYNLEIADGTQNRTKANALLMSKAPKMLEILDEVLMENLCSAPLDLKIRELIKEATEIH